MPHRGKKKPASAGDSSSSTSAKRKTSNAENHGAGAPSSAETERRASAAAAAAAGVTTESASSAGAAATRGKKKHQLQQQHNRKAKVRAARRAETAVPTPPPRSPSVASSATPSSSSSSGKETARPSAVATPEQSSLTSPPTRPQQEGQQPATTTHLLGGNTAATAAATPSPMTVAALAAHGAATATAKSAFRRTTGEAVGYTDYSGSASRGGGGTSGRSGSSGSGGGGERSSSSGKPARTRSSGSSHTSGSSSNETHFMAIPDSPVELLKRFFNSVWAQSWLGLLSSSGFHLFHIILVLLFLTSPMTMRTVSFSSKTMSADLLQAEGYTKTVNETATATTGAAAPVAANAVLVESIWAIHDALFFVEPGHKLLDIPISHSFSRVGRKGHKKKRKTDKPKSNDDNDDGNGGDHSYVTPETRAKMQQEDGENDAEDERGTGRSHISRLAASGLAVDAGNGYGGVNNSGNSGVDAVISNSTAASNLSTPSSRSGISRFMSPPPVTTPRKILEGRKPEGSKGVSLKAIAKAWEASPLYSSPLALVVYYYFYLIVVAVVLFATGGYVTGFLSLARLPVAAAELIWFIHHGSHSFLIFSWLVSLSHTERAATLKPDVPFLNHGTPYVVVSKATAKAYFMWYYTGTRSGSTPGLHVGPLDEERYLYSRMEFLYPAATVAATVFLIIVAVNILRDLARLLDAIAGVRSLSEPEGFFLCPLCNELLPPSLRLVVTHARRRQMSAIFDAWHELRQHGWRSRLHVVWNSVAGCCRSRKASANGRSGAPHPRVDGYVDMDDDHFDQDACHGLLGDCREPEEDRRATLELYGRVEKEEALGELRRLRAYLRAAGATTDGIPGSSDEDTTEEDENEAGIVKVIGSNSKQPLRHQRNTEKTPLLSIHHREATRQQRMYVDYTTRHVQHRCRKLYLDRVGEDSGSDSDGHDDSIDEASSSSEGSASDSLRTPTGQTSPLVGRKTDSTQRRRSSGFAGAAAADQKQPASRQQRGTSPRRAGVMTDGAQPMAFARTDSGSVGESPVRTPPLRPAPVLTNLSFMDYGTMAAVAAATAAGRGTGGGGAGRGGVPAGVTGLNDANTSRAVAAVAGGSKAGTGGGTNRIVDRTIDPLKPNEDEFRPGNAFDSLRTASWLSRITFSWMNPLMNFALIEPTLLRQERFLPSLPEHLGALEHCAPAWRLWLNRRSWYHEAIEKPADALIPSDEALQRAEEVALGDMHETGAGGDDDDDETESSDNQTVVILSNKPLSRAKFRHQRPKRSMKERFVMWLTKPVRFLFTEIFMSFYIHNSYAVRRTHQRLVRALLKDRITFYAASQELTPEELYGNGGGGGDNENMSSNANGSGDVGILAEMASSADSTDGSRTEGSLLPSHTRRQLALYDVGIFFLFSEHDCGRELLYYCGAVRLAYDLASLLTVPLLAGILSMQIANSEDDTVDVSEGLYWCLLVFGLLVVQNLLNQEYWRSVSESALTARSILSTFVLEKVMAMPLAQRTFDDDDVVRLITVETHRCHAALTHLHLCWSHPLRILLVCALLYVYMGTAPAIGALVGACVLVPLLRWQESVVHRAARGIPSPAHRLSLLRSVMAQFQQAKALLLEGAFARRIGLARAEEGKGEAEAGAAEAFASTVAEIGMSSIFVICFALHYAEGGTFDALTLIPSVAALVLLWTPIMDFPRLFAFTARGYLSMKRVEAFLRQSPDEFQCTWVDLTESSALAAHYGRRRGAVFCQRCSFTWQHDLTQEMPRALLTDVTMDIAPGELVVVQGPVKGGKSSLLLAILGEINRCVDADGRSSFESSFTVGEESVLSLVSFGGASTPGSASYSATPTNGPMRRHTPAQHQLQSARGTGGGSESFLPPRMPMVSFSLPPNSKTPVSPRPASVSAGSEGLRADGAGSTGDGGEGEAPVPVHTSTDGFLVFGMCVYCPEVPWLQSDSVQKNIIAGSGVFQARWYRQVTHACALLSDFEQFPQGDATVIGGEKGYALTTSQKVRIALARALYTRADIYLFDNLLIYLDRSTREHVIREVFHKLLRHKTVIICSNLGLAALQPHRVFTVLETGKVREDTALYDIVNTNRSGLSPASTTVVDESHNATGDPGSRTDSLACSGSASVESRQRLRQGGGDETPLMLRHSRELMLPNLYAVEVEEPVVRLTAADAVDAGLEGQPLLDEDDMAGSWHFYQSSNDESDSSSNSDDSDSDGSSGSESSANSSGSAQRKKKKKNHREKADHSHSDRDDDVDDDSSAGDASTVAGGGDNDGSGGVGVAAMDGRANTSSDLGNRHANSSRSQSAASAASVTTAPSSPSDSSSSETREAHNGNFNSRLLAHSRLQDGHEALYSFLICFLGSQSIWLLIGIGIQQLLRLAADVWIAVWLHVHHISEGVDDEITHQERKVASKRFLTVYAIIVVSSSVLVYGRMRLVGRLIGAQLQTLYTLAMEYVLRAAPAFFDLQTVNLISNVLSKDIEATARGVPESVDLILTCVLQLGAIAAFNAALNPLFLLVLPVALLLSLRVSERFAVVSREVRRLEARSGGTTVAIMREVLLGAPTVRCLALQDRIREEYCNSIDITNTAAVVGVMADRWVSLRLQFITVLLATVAAMLGIIFDNLRPEPAFTSIAIITCLRTGHLLASMSKRMDVFRGQWAAIQRLAELLHVPSESLVIHPSINASSSSTAGPTAAVHDSPLAAVGAGEGEDEAGSASEGAALELVHVSARPRRGLPYSLRDFSLRVEAGECVGLAGEAGSGKTAVLAVLLRLTEVLGDGRVVVCGQDAARVPYPVLRSCFGYIPADPLMLEGSWRSNLLASSYCDQVEPRPRQQQQQRRAHSATACVPTTPEAFLEGSVGSDSSLLLASQGRPQTTTPSSTVSDASLWRALRATGLEGLVEISGGLDAPLLGEEDTSDQMPVSQRRMVCLARAIIRRPPVLLIEDTPTTTEDAQADTFLSAALADNCLLQGTTTVIVVHRAATLKLCSRVVTMSGGTVIGNYDRATLDADTPEGVAARRNVLDCLE